MRISIAGIVYLLIGLIVALNQGYNATDANHVLSLIMAIILWPFILLFGWHFSISIF